MTIPTINHRGIIRRRRLLSDSLFFWCLLLLPFSIAPNYIFQDPIFIVLFRGIIAAGVVINGLILLAAGSTALQWIRLWQLHAAKLDHGSVQPLILQIEDLRTYFKIARRLRLKWIPSNTSIGATVTGLLRPCLVLTGGLVVLAVRDPRRARAILAHELAHLKRGDIKVYLLFAIPVLQIAAAAYFGLFPRYAAWALFQPVPIFILTLFLLRRREFSADSLAIGSGADPLRYAVGLMESQPQHRFDLWHPSPLVRTKALLYDSPVLGTNLIFTITIVWLLLASSSSFLNQPAAVFRVLLRLDYERFAAGVLIRSQAGSVLDGVPLPLRLLALLSFIALTLQTIIIPLILICVELRKGLSNRIATSNSGEHTDTSYRPPPFRLFSRWRSRVSAALLDFAGAQPLTTPGRQGADALLLAWLLVPRMSSRTRSLVKALCARQDYATVTVIARTCHFNDDPEAMAIVNDALIHRARELVASGNYAGALALFDKQNAISLASIPGSPEEKLLNELVTHALSDGDVISARRASRVSDTSWSKSAIEVALNEECRTLGETLRSHPSERPWCLEQSTEALSELETTASARAFKESSVRRYLSGQRMKLAWRVGIAVILCTLISYVGLHVGRLMAAGAPSSHVEEVNSWLDSIAPSHHGNAVAVAGQNSIKYFAPNSDVPIDLESPPFQIADIAFSEDDTSLLVCGSSGEIAEISIQSHKILYNESGGANFVPSVRGPEAS